MRNCNVIDIGLRFIKRCGMYSKEYKNWIAWENKSPPIVKTSDSFKEYWSGAIALVNQMAAPASQHGYNMAAVDKDASIALYTKMMLNFGAAYGATQESMKSQASSLATMQGQLTNIQQFCMAVGQQPSSNIYQPPSNSYPPTQPQHTIYNRGGRDRGRVGGGHGSSNQQPTLYGFGGAGAHQAQCAPTLQALQKLELMLLTRWQRRRYPHKQSMWKTQPDAQPNVNLRQHDGQVGGGGAQVHPTLGGWPHCAANHPLPTATATCLPLVVHCTHVDARPSTPTGVLH